MYRETDPNDDYRCWLPREHPEYKPWTYAAKQQDAPRIVTVNRLTDEDSGYGAGV